MSFTFDKTKAALLVMDYQVGIVENFIQGDPGVLAGAIRALAAARQVGLKVIHDKVFPRQADVLDVAAFADALGAP